MEKNLEELKELFDDNPDEASRTISFAEKKMAGFMRESDTDKLEEMNDLILSSTSGMKPADRASYLLGKAHAITEVASFFNQPYEQERLAKSLSEREVLILKLIKENDDITPAMLAKELNTSPQNIVNYLNRLKTKSLIKVLYAGKNAWYSLSSVGKKTLEARYKPVKPDITGLIEEEQMLKERIRKEEALLKDLQAIIDDLHNEKGFMEAEMADQGTGVSALSGAAYSGPDLSPKGRKVSPVAAKKAASLRGKQTGIRGKKVDAHSADEFSRHVVSPSRKPKRSKSNRLKPMP
ncbi:MAG: winged helix-turn-helix transcriptional regulator [Syntrophomonas sp.]